MKDKGPPANSRRDPPPCSAFSARHDFSCRPAVTAAIMRGRAAFCRRHFVSPSYREFSLSFLTIFAIAVALAMDALAVSLTTGIRLRSVDAGHTLRMAGTFGGFQFAMPVIGWLLGVGAQKYIESYDHWLAFALLAFVGGRMLKEAWENRGKAAEECEFADPTRGSSLWLLGIATSLDALAVGLSLALLKINVWFPAAIIGVVCFCITAAGLHLGKCICRVPALSGLGNKANALGGLVLIAIGLKILQEHGVLG